MTESLKEWQRDVGGFVPRPQLPDYAAKYASFARLRRRLDRSGPPVIETVIGEGYRLRAGDSPS